MNSTTIQLVGRWIRGSKPVSVLPVPPNCIGAWRVFPHDCIMELAGTCLKCEELAEWDDCVMEEWKDNFGSFFATCSCAQAATGHYDS